MNKLELYKHFCVNYPITYRTSKDLIELFQICDSTSSPLINITHDNEIVLEYWKGKKKLTVYVCEEVIDYIKVWGPDMDNEMEDGSIELKIEEVRELWYWLCDLTMS